MEKRKNNIKKIAKKVIPKETYKKIKKVPEKEEKENLFKHSLCSNLEMKSHYLEKKIKEYSDKHDLFHLFAKIKLLNLKLKYFSISFDKKDLKIVLNIIKEIEKELNKLVSK